jgi:hypothetical protein
MDGRTDRHTETDGWVEGWTDRETDMTKLLFAFRIFRTPLKSTNGATRFHSLCTESRTIDRRRHLDIIRIFQKF